MEKVINLSKSVYDLCKAYPEIIDIMKELGFESITKPNMLQTAGRIMTIEKGAAMKGVDLGIIKEAFISKGFSIE